MRVNRQGRSGQRLTASLWMAAGLIAGHHLVSGAAPTEPGAARAVDPKRAIGKRDAMIENLLRRLQRLEHRAAALESNGEAAPAPAPTVADPALPVPPVPPPPPAAAAAERQNAEAAAPAPGGAGAIEIDEEAAERALERSLVRTGALLLPAGKLELEPSVTYTREENEWPIFVTGEDETLLAEERLKRDEVTADLELRIGLPFDAQLELGIPYQWANDSDRFQVGLSPVMEDDESGSGVGDPRFGLAKTLLRESGWRPNLIGRITWDTDWGEDESGGVDLDGGVNELRASLVATRRQDPMVFIGGLSYEAALEQDDIDPGDEISFNLGAALAVSPETSLRVLFQQSFSDEAEVDGRTVAGSDQNSSLLSLGASTILGRDTLLDISVGAGLNDDAPDFFVGVALPIRFP